MQGEAWTRIDQIYAPDDHDIMYLHVDCEDFFLHAKDRIELDHVAVEIASEEEDESPRGTEITRIDEEIFTDEKFNAGLQEMLQGMVDQTQQEEQPDWIQAWEHIKAQAKVMNP